MEDGAGEDTYAGALVRRGEATAEVTATGCIPNSDARQNCPPARGQFAAEGGTADVRNLASQRWCDPADRWVRLLACDAVERGHSSADVCSCRKNGSATRDLYACDALGVGRWRSWVFCRRGSRLSMKQQPSMSCARIRRGLDSQRAFCHQRPSDAGVDEAYLLGMAALASLRVARTQWTPRFDPPPRTSRHRAAKAEQVSALRPGEEDVGRDATEAKGGAQRVVKGALLR